ncbi:MAG: DUF192 domain-containing protein [Yoonia sp.]|nr:DUF192 domain-containing protein [Yoonia sp.]
MYLKTFILTLGLLGATATAQASCVDDKITVTGEFGRAVFTVDVADDNQERAQGLMNVPDMALLSGMLFVYDAPQRATFWMRNTLIGLDMLFAAPDGMILKIHPNAIPHDETVIDGGDGVQYVLEINAGLAARLGIDAGDSLHHPAILSGTDKSCE